jgi:HD superfamily phosphodiesterase
MVIIAAWFHDTGYIKGSENHENESVCIVSDFLKEKINQMNTYKKLLVLYEQLRSIMCQTLEKNNQRMLIIHFTRIIIQ